MGFFFVSKLSVTQLLQLWHYLNTTRDDCFSIRSLKCLFLDHKLNVRCKKIKCFPAFKMLITRHEINPYNFSVIKVITDIEFNGAIDGGK